MRCACCVRCGAKPLAELLQFVRSGQSLKGGARVEVEYFKEVLEETVVLSRVD